MLLRESSRYRMSVLVMGVLSALSITNAMSVNNVTHEIKPRPINLESQANTWFTKEAEEEFEKLSGYNFHRGPPTPIKVPICDMENGDCSMEKIKSNANTVVYPGKDTQCIDSTTPYYFQVMPGNGKGLLINFSGGGACWMNKTNTIGSCYGSNVLAAVSPEVIQNPYQGVFDKKHPKNPFADYTIITISYCSGDVHAGDVTHTYENVVKNGAPVTVRQAGKNNTMATLEWVKKNIPEPEKLVVMGCSAGAIGAQLWGGFIANMYADNAVPPVTSVVADSYAGIFPASQAKMFEVYGISRAPFTHRLPEPLLEKVKAGSIYFCEMLDALHQIYSDVSYLTVQSKADVVQTFFYDAVANSLGEGPEVLKTDAPQCAVNSIPISDVIMSPRNFYDASLGMFQSFAKPKNFASYLINSMYHCYTCFDRFYTTEIEVDGAGFWGLWEKENISLASWLEQATLSKAGVEIDLKSRCQALGYRVGGDWLQSVLFLFLRCPSQ